MNILVPHLYTFHASAVQAEIVGRFAHTMAVNREPVKKMLSVIDTFDRILPERCYLLRIIKFLF